MVQFISTHLNALKVPEEGDVEEEELADIPATTEEEAKLLNSKFKDKSFSTKVISIFKIFLRFVDWRKFEKRRDF